MFAQPTTSGDNFNVAENEGNLLLITPLEKIDEIDTAHGPTSAVRARVVVVESDGSGERFDDTLIFPKVIQGQLKRIGQPVLGRLGKGEKKAGKSAPWILTEFSAADARAAETYISQNPSFTAVEDSENIPF